MAKRPELKPRPDRESGDRGVRPLSRTRTKVFVILAILSAFAFVAFTIFMLIRSMEDPGIQQGLDEYRRDTGQTPTDTTLVVPREGD